MSLSGYRDVWSGRAERAKDRKQGGRKRRGGKRAGKAEDSRQVTGVGKP